MEELIIQTLNATAQKVTKSMVSPLVGYIRGYSGDLKSLNEDIIDDTWSLMDVSILTNSIAQSCFWSAILGYDQAGENGPANVTFQDLIAFAINWGDPTIRLAFNKPFKDAMEYLLGKNYIVNEGSWKNVWQEANARGFTVAHVGKMDVLQDIRGYIEKALEEGTTLKQFKRDLIPKLKERGWWAEKGEEAWTILPDGSRRKRLQAWRLDIIYSTNISVANDAGQWKMFKETTDIFPYLTYNCSFLPNSRETHKALHGLVWKKDDPALERIAPKNGWNCHCWLENTDEFDLNESIPRGDYADWDNPDNWTKRRVVDGLPDWAEESIEEGWDFNPGSAGMDSYWPDAEKYDKKLWDKFKSAIDEADISISHKIITQVPESITKQEISLTESGPREWIPKDKSEKFKKFEAALAKHFGIEKVDFAGDVNIASYIKEGLLVAKKKGFNMPKQILVDVEKYLKRADDADSIITWGPIGSYSSKSDTLFINPRNPIWNDPINGFRELYESKKFSSKQPYHFVIHELAHRTHYKKYLNKYKLASKSTFTKIEYELIKKEVSNYAATKPREFVAEIITGMMAGIKYPSSIMDLFNKYWGES